MSSQREQVERGLKPGGFHPLRVDVGLVRVRRLVADLVPRGEHEGLVRHGSRDALRAGERA